MIAWAGEEFVDTKAVFVPVVAESTLCFPHISHFHT